MALLHSTNKAVGNSNDPRNDLRVLVNALIATSSRIVGSPETIRQLVKNRLSDNVGGVKQFSGTPHHALVEERHFALVEAVALFYQRRNSK